MLNRTRGLVSVVLAVAATAIFSFPVAAQDVPAQLQPPANQQLLLRVHAKGDQIYTCKADAATAFVDAESSRRAALRQKRPALRQTFRRPFLGSERRQPRYRQSRRQRAVSRRRFHPLASGQHCGPRRKRCAVQGHHHPAHQHQRRQSPRDGLRRVARRPGTSRAVHR